MTSVGFFMLQTVSFSDFVDLSISRRDRHQHFEGRYAVLDGLGASTLVENQTIKDFLCTN